MNPFFVILSLLWAGLATAAPFIVEDGEPRAEIVIGEQPTRSADMGAEELQRYIQKISGATLPIVAAPTGAQPVTIFVGKSEHAPELETPTSDDGAYRMVSGDTWLALIGYDWDFVPVGPWARNHGHWNNNVLPAWREMTNSHWSNPIASRIYRDYHGRASTFEPGAPRSVNEYGTGMWAFDICGSRNAVYGYLRSLGVRWYMPGELGEIVPQMTTIELPQVDETVQPDFRLRYANYALYGRDDDASILWAMRNGANDFYGEILSHGMREITDPAEMKEAHPEYYALYGGERNTVERKANQCFSSPGLFEETLRYIRALYDIHDVRVASVMPSDGYSRLCSCELCAGKATPERGGDGVLSDYVWDFTNRIAKEIAKTHPDRYISNFAYSTYRLPPEKIDQLEPNIIVGIVHGRQSRDLTPEGTASMEALRQGWLEKTDNPLIVWINYPQMTRGAYVPPYWPRTTAQSIRNTKGQSQGEFTWLPADRGLAAPGVSHLSVYMYMRYLWDADQDIDAVLGEYYRLFYGPAASQMHAFIEHCEANYHALSKDGEVVTQALELFKKAQQQVEPDSLYGQRIALVDDFLTNLRHRQTQLLKQRGPVPTVEMVDRDRGRWKEDREPFKLDGKIEERFWHAMPSSCSGSLVINETGGGSPIGTVFRTVWAHNQLYIAIQCDDFFQTPMTITTKQDDDPALFDGDFVSIQLETEQHAWYEIAINPAGAVADLDHSFPDNAKFEWDSKAQVAVQINDRGWSLEAIIPIDPDSDDPNHLVAGRKPMASFPWFINVCRQRVRDNGNLTTCWSPTGTTAYRQPLSFGRLHIR